MSSTSVVSNDNRDGPAGGSEPRRLGRRFRLTALFLFVSAILFCLVVVRQRDARSKLDSLRWAERIESSLQQILDERGFLPRKLPEGLELKKGEPLAHYPNSIELSQLEASDQPFLIIAGPRKGLILPATDGCACVLFDDGKVTAAWLSMSEWVEAHSRRKKLLAGSPDGV